MLLKWLLLGLMCAFSVMASAQTHVKAYYHNYSDDYTKVFDAALSKVATAYDVNLKVFDGNDDRELQNNQLSYAFATNSAAIVNLVDPKDAARNIERARKTNSRIIFFNIQPKLDEISSYDNAWYVGTSGRISGIYQAQIVHDYFHLQRNDKYDTNGNRKLDLVILQGTNVGDETKKRTNAVVETLTRIGYWLNPTAISVANFDKKQAKEVIKKIIKESGIDSVELIICNNDAMALGAVEALNSHGYNTGDTTKNYIPIIGIDGTPEAMKAIKDGKMTGTVFADFTALALVCLKIACAGGKENERLAEDIWYSYSNRMIFIPYNKFSNFKNYQVFSYYDYTKKKEQCSHKINYLVALQTMKVVDFFTISTFEKVSSRYFS